MTLSDLKEQNKKLLAENKMLRTKYKSMYEYCKAVIQLTRVICNLDNKEYCQRND